MDWTDRLKDWAEDAVDDRGSDGIFDKVGDFLGEQVDGSWAQDLVDAGTDDDLLPDGRHGNLRPAIGSFPDDATASCRHDRRDLGRSSRRPDRSRHRP